MAIAETASLLADLRLKDGLTPGVATAVGSVDRLESRLGGLQGRLGNFASNLRGGVSNALSTFSGRLQGAARAGLGLLGIGGLFTIGAGIRSSIDNARQFGDTVIQVSRLTGLAADQTSRLVDAVDYFGVTGDKAIRIAGMYEKNVDRLAGTKKKAADFEKEYGLKVRDSSGGLLDFNEQLLASADFFNNKSIPASEKAAALSKLYGRSWQDLIPVLAQGRKGIQDAQKDAISLSEADLRALKENKEATRAWNDAIGDLQIKIGIGLLPTITELIRGLTGWVDSHGPQIQEFFRNGVATAKSVAGAAVGVLSSIKSVWDGIPDPVKELLIKGFVADRTVKFLFGFSVAGVVKDLAGGVVGGLGNALVRAGIGKAFVQPVFVTNQGFGGGGGPGVPGGPAAAGGSSILGSLAAGAAPMLAAALLPILIVELTKTALGGPAEIARRAEEGRRQTAEARGINTSNMPAGGTPTWLRGPTPPTLKVFPQGMSPDERQAINDQRAKLDGIRGAQESLNITTRTNLSSARTAIRTSGSNITAALASLRMKALVPININIAGVTIRTYQGATWLNRSGMVYTGSHPY